MTACPGDLTLCGAPCDCEGRQASHRPPTCTKVRFDTLDAAEATLADIRHERGRPKGRNVRKVERRAYRCPQCQGYHLTSKPMGAP